MKPMLAGVVDFVIGVDTHRDSHTAAVIEANTGGVVAQITVATDAFGYRRLRTFADAHTSGRRVWAIEGTGSYGSGFTTDLLEHNEWVVEIDRPAQPASRNGAKSDDLDAVRAAREALSREHLAAPRARGDREALRVLMAARQGAVVARTKAIGQLKALIVNAPQALRDQLRRGTTDQQLQRCARLRTLPTHSVEHRATVRAIRGTARRALTLEAEAAEYETEIEQLVVVVCPVLLERPGIGAITAAQFIVSWSHAGRIRSEAAFASLGGVAPIQASSGTVTRHRLNRSGDRQLNRALHTVALTRLKIHEPTKAYAARRTSEGKSPRNCSLFTRRNRTVFERRRHGTGATQQLAASRIRLRSLRRNPCGMPVRSARLEMHEDSVNQRAAPCAWTCWRDTSSLAGQHGAQVAATRPLRVAPMLLGAPSEWEMIMIGLSSAKPRYLAPMVLCAAVALPQAATAAPPDGGERAPSSANVAASATGGAPPTIVGLGDSYMSGSGVIRANRNFKDATATPQWAWWQTAQGDPSGEPPRDPSRSANATSSVWGQVYGDANDYPLTDGKERLPFCDRSYAAPMHIDKQGWKEANLACSGAKVISRTVTQTDGSSCTSMYFKPGIDDLDREVPLRYCPNRGVTGTVKGQAKSLANLAQSDPGISVVALSIGSGDFGFTDILQECSRGYSTGVHCESSAAMSARLVKGASDTRKAVELAVKNIGQSMKDAGYAESSWRLLLQLPPLPIGAASDNAFGQAGTARENIGGCGFYDATLDWIGKSLYPTMTDAMVEGIESARGSLGAVGISIVDTKNAFAEHRLCSKSVKQVMNYPTNLAGRTPTWQDDNGRRTEWVNPIQPDKRAITNEWQESQQLQPNYWGQRALADCMNQATDVAPYGSAMRWSCIQDPKGTSRGASGAGLPGDRPVMQLIDFSALWATSSGVPVITGAPKVGLTVGIDKSGVFQPARAAMEFGYQWLLDGKPISGADKSTYKLVAGDVGKKLTVKVTAWPAGQRASSRNSATAVSSAVTVLAAPVVPLVNTSPPKISGAAVVDSPLKVEGGTFQPAGQVTYQWLVENKPVAGATGTTFTPTASDAGKQVTVKVVAVSGSQRATAVSAPVTVGLATASVTGTPTITGSPVTGQTLSADPGSVSSSPADDYVSYQWYSDGKPIAGATKRSYTITGDVLATSITVAVVTHRKGYADATSRQSAPLGPVGPGVVKAIKEIPIVCVDPLTGKSTALANLGGRCAGAVQPQLAGSFTQYPNGLSVQWLANGRPIPNATGIQYVPEPTDVDANLSAMLRPQEEGFENKPARTTPARVTAAPVLAKAPSPYIPEDPRVGRVLHVTKAHFTAKRPMRYQWWRSGPTVRSHGHPIKGARGRTYTVRRADRGHQLWVRVTTKPSKKYMKGSLVSYLSGRVRAGRVHGNG